MSEEEAPKGKRKRVRRLVIGLVAFVAVVTLLRVTWGIYANGRLLAVVEDIRDRGEPLEWTELEPPAVPDERNAAVFYRRAVEIPLLQAREDDYGGFCLEDGTTGGLDQDRLRRLYVLNDMVGYCVLVHYPEFRREHADDLRQILEEARPALDLVRQARGMEADYGMDFSGPAVSAFLEVSFTRELARLLCNAAVAAQDQRRDGEAVEYMRDALALGDSLQQEPTLISPLIAIWCDSLTSSALEALTHSLRIGPAASDARPEQVKALIEHLLNDEPRRMGFHRAFLGERSTQYDTMERVRAGEFSISGLSGMGGTESEPSKTLTAARNLAIGPLLTNDQATLLRYTSSYVDASKAHDRPEWSRLRRASPEARETERKMGGSAWFKWTHPLTNILAPSLDRAAELHFRSLAARRLAATGLAIRMYELDHGRRPEKLADLVPRYLPKVPIDPFDAKPLKYRPDLSKPVLYSVADDGVDDRGERDIFGEEDDDYGHDESGDLLFYLNGERPRPECDWENPLAPSGPTTMPGPPASRRSPSSTTASGSRATAPSPASPD